MLAESDDGAKKFQRAFALVASIFVISLIAFISFSDVFRGSKIGGEDGKPGGEFTLNSYHGDVSLSDFRGKVVMMYFGFLSCKMVCPTSMGIIKNTLERLSEEELNDVQVLLISVDPDRDTLEDLEIYSKKFHSNIIGLTGDHEALDLLKNEYGAYFKLEEDDSSDLDYVFRHTSRYFIIDQNGELVDAMRHGSTANELLARIKTLI